MRRSFWVSGCASVLLSALAAGCSAGGPGDGPLGEAQEAICPAAPASLGVDVSIYQGTCTWPTAKSAGTLGFAITRTQDGTNAVDSTFAPNWAGIKAAGMVRGAYQFFRASEDPTAQANIVIGAVGKLGPGDLPVTADVEVSDGVGAATLTANLQTWLDAVEAGTGKKPIVYTSPGLWSSIAGNSTAFGSYPLWVADWTYSTSACPTLPAGWSNYVAWQYSDMGHINGIGGSAVDLDVWNGDPAAFAGGGGDAYAAQFVSQTWPYATTTIQITAGQSMPASITLKNIGTKSWDSNTKLGTTVPRDRSSPFVGSDWLAPNRLAAVTGTVAPGSTFDFKFTWVAPTTAGMYDEHYDLVEEGVTWFGDQGGPPDSDIEAKLQVNPTAAAASSSSSGAGGASATTASSSSGAGGAVAGSGGATSSNGGATGGGASGTGGSSESHSSSTTSSGFAGVLPASVNQGSCGCRVPGEDEPAGAPRGTWLVASIAALVAARRRRSRPH